MAIIFSKFNPFPALKKAISGRDKAEEAAEVTPCFNARQEEEEAYEAVERGTLMVPLDKIVGSVGRYHDFDSRFRTSSHNVDERLKGILDAMKEGKNLPPIALYQIKDDYYILDGHHRYRAARELERSHIRSRIVELLPSKNTLENKLYIERIGFRDKAGLPGAVELTELGGAFAIRNAAELKEVLNRLYEDQGFYQAASRICSDYVARNTGATRRILDGIFA